MCLKRRQRAGCRQGALRIAGPGKDDRNTSAKDETSGPHAGQGLQLLDKHPAHFKVMWQTELHNDDPAVTDARLQAYGALVALVRSEDEQQTNDRANRAWALAHGWAALLLSGSMELPSGMTALDYVREQLATASVSQPG